GNDFARDFEPWHIARAWRWVVSTKTLLNVGAVYAGRGYFHQHLALAGLRHRHPIRLQHLRPAEPVNADVGHAVGQAHRFSPPAGCLFRPGCLAQAQPHVTVNDDRSGVLPNWPHSRPRAAKWSLREIGRRRGNSSALNRKPAHSRSKLPQPPPPEKP